MAEVRSAGNELEQVGMAVRGAASGSAVGGAGCHMQCLDGQVRESFYSQDLILAMQRGEVG